MHPNVHSSTIYDSQDTEALCLSRDEWMKTRWDISACILIHLSCVQHYASPPGSSIHGTLQARTLEWVSMSSSRGCSQPRDRTPISYIYLRWQVGLLPLVPPGKPMGYIYIYSTVCIYIYIHTVEY